MGRGGDRITRRAPERLRAGGWTRNGPGFLQQLVDDAENLGLVTDRVAAGPFEGTEVLRL